MCGRKDGGNKFVRLSDKVGVPRLGVIGDCRCIGNG
ncbi:Protein of unknown function [Pyronema omphalodes CBS 100304]|uniref:Uncharacterized protein n=1 Tax=Pyronema omphalodes (strain CBS 100304) TaxID=1076935 RepID=U4LUD6_PYROM|nr:Protein of unknown function [Pyronema omphalodes CBS 100304]